MVDKYKVITLCGSTRFKDEFMQAQKSLTLDGNIVISVGLFGHAGDDEVWENMAEGTWTSTKAMLDDMHKRKIDMADEIYVINVGGYIGESTREEIEYAKQTGKKVRYYEETSPEHIYEVIRAVSEEKDPLTGDRLDIGDLEKDENYLAAVSMLASKYAEPASEEPAGEPELEIWEPEAEAEEPEITAEEDLAWAQEETGPAIEEETESEIEESEPEYLSEGYEALVIEEEPGIIRADEEHDLDYLAAEPEPGYLAEEPVYDHHVEAPELEYLTEVYEPEEEGGESVEEPEPEETAEEAVEEQAAEEPESEEPEEPESEEVYEEPEADYLTAEPELDYLTDDPEYDYHEEAPELEYLTEEYETAETAEFEEAEEPFEDEAAEEPEPEEEAEEAVEETAEEAEPEEAEEPEEELEPELSDEEVSEMVTAAGILSRGSSDEKAEALHILAKLFREVGTYHQLSMVVPQMFYCLIMAGRYSTSEDMYAKAIDLYGDKVINCGTLLHLANQLYYADSLYFAKVYAGRALDMGPDEDQIEEIGELLDMIRSKEVNI